MLPAPTPARLDSSYPQCVDRGEVSSSVAMRSLAPVRRALIRPTLADLYRLSNRLRAYRCDSDGVWSVARPDSTAPSSAPPGDAVVRCGRGTRVGGAMTTSPWSTEQVTESAAWMENLTRWVGIVIAILGALLANPDATMHSAAVQLERVKAAGRRTREIAARVIPALRRSVTVQGATAEGFITAPAGMVTADGLVGWTEDATTDDKIEVLSQRTKVLHRAVTDLRLLIERTEQQLGDRLTAEVNRLAADTAALFGYIDELQEEKVRFDATALLLTVVGVVLADLSSDAGNWPMWFSILVLMVGVVLAVVSARKLINAWRGSTVRRIAGGPQPVLCEPPDIRHANPRRPMDVPGPHAVLVAPVRPQLARTPPPVVGEDFHEPDVVGPEVT